MKGCVTLFEIFAVGTIFLKLTDNMAKIPFSFGLRIYILNFSHTTFEIILVSKTFHCRLSDTLELQFYDFVSSSVEAFEAFFPWHVDTNRQRNSLNS